MIEKVWNRENMEYKYNEVSHVFLEIKQAEDSQEIQSVYSSFSISSISNRFP